MPERNFDALDGARRRKAVEYIPGYDWIPGKFGPPPGIPKARKDEFDRMTDKEYLYAFLKLTQEEKESLMVSEAERRRTFAAHWPIESIVKAHDCAKEGFYYTGVADRVQCAFCGGIVRNWERGDVPKFQHKNFFSYCKMVQNKPCQNIPISNCGLPKDLMTNQLSSSSGTDNRPTTLGDLNINTVRPKDPALSVFSKRKDTYKRYPHNNPIEADRLCDAGFIYEGIGDKVKCFWCDGALEMWSRGDDPWTEHAKWYPGCTYVQQTKGLDFIRKARSQMTPDNIATADTLLYNKGDVSFLDDELEVEPEVVSVDKLDGYEYCRLLGYKEEDIKRALQPSGEEYTREAEKKQKEETTSVFPSIHSFVEGAENAGGQSSLKFFISKDNEDMTPAEWEEFVTRTTCRICKQRPVSAILLPCGCMCLCVICCYGPLPPTCPLCNKVVTGSLEVKLTTSLKQ